MAMYNMIKNFETKENKIQTKVKIEPQHKLYMQTLLELNS